MAPEHELNARTCRMSHTWDSMMSGKLNWPSECEVMNEGVADSCGEHPYSSSHRSFFTQLQCVNAFKFLTTTLRVVSKATQTGT